MKLKFRIGLGLIRIEIRADAELRRTGKIFEISFGFIRIRFRMGRRIKTD